MTTIVFSKDRAMQLDAFLRSFRAHVSPAGTPVHVLFRGTNARHDAAYVEVFAQHADFVTAHRQGASFKADVLGLLPAKGIVVFFVDDQVFVRPWAVQQIDGLSLRLSPHLTKNYASNDAPQPVPALVPVFDYLLTWKWRDGELAWGYPLSVDGHLYDVHDVRQMLEAIAFTSPNTMESGLQAFVEEFLDRPAYCYTYAKVVNIPWNQVQDDWNNRCSNVYTSDQLLTLWEHGQRVDLEPLTGLVNESVHQVLPLLLEPR